VTLNEDGHLPEPRPVCPRCRRACSVCTCAHLVPVPTRTRIVVLQHPRERRVSVGTARLAHLALPGSILRVGVDFAEDPVVAAALAGPRPAYVLYPRPGAVAPEDLPPEPITLVVLDGTWAQARKLLRLNPALGGLPGISLAPRAASTYRIRRQPAPFCVSTVEALAQTLAALEPGTDVAALLAPFQAMVAQQERFAREVKASRHRHDPGQLRPRRRPALPGRLASEWARLVCVQGEANAWPRRGDRWEPAEIVHWVAHRPSTGERYQAIVAPRRPLAPGTPKHTGLPAEQLRGGVGAEAWRQSWQDFLRAGDVLVQWGTYYGDLAESEGLPPAARLDLRAEISRMLNRRVGTVEACADALGLQAPAAGPGRGERRLATLVAAVHALAAAAVT
jgi:DTW domain-containing protein YfiP